MAKVTERKIFMGANTADGFVGFFDQIVDNYELKKIYIIKGGSGVGKSTFIKKFAQTMTQMFGKTKQLTIDYLMCSADPGSYDGAIIHEMGVALIDGTKPHITDPKYPGMVEEILDFAQFIDFAKIKATQAELKEMMARRAECFERAKIELEKARQLHRKVESYITPAVDFSKVDELFKQLVNRQ